MLIIETVGNIAVSGCGKERPRVVILGDREDVAALGGLYGENVAVMARHEAREMSEKAESTGPAALALYYGLIVQRRYLRSMIEQGCRGRDGVLEVDADNPPWPHSLDDASRPDVKAALVAIREGEKVLRALRSDLDPREDNAPAWLDQVIDGEIEI